MFWHIDTDIISFFIIFALYYYTVKMLPGDQYTTQNKSFVRCLRAGVVMTPIDIASSLIMDLPISRFLYHLLMTAYLLVQDLLIVMWLLYALTILYKSDEKKRRRISAFTFALYALYALLVLSNPRSELFFSLGPNMEYARGPLFLPGIVGLFFLYCVLLLGLVFIRRKEIPAGYPVAVLLMSPLILSVSIVVQLLNPGWLVIFGGYTLCLVLAFLFFQNLRVRSERAQLHQLTEMIGHFACGMAICAIRRDNSLEVQYLSDGLGVLCELDAAELRNRFNRDMLTGVHPDDRAMVEDKLREMALTKEDHEMTYRYITDSGKQKWLNVSAQAVQTDDGFLVYATYTDLTELKTSEQQLRESEKALWMKYEFEKKRLSLAEENLLVHALFNLTTGEILEYNYRDGSEVPASDRTAFAYSKANAELLIDEDERARFLKLNDADTLLARFAEGEGEFRLEYRRRLPGGGVTWIRSSLHLLRDPRSGDVLLFEYWYDVEAEKMIELMYRSIATDNYDFVARIDGRTGCFEVLAKAGLKYHMPPQFGEDADAVTLSLYSEYVVPEDREATIQNSLLANVNRHLQERGRYVFTYRMTLPDGSLRYKKVTQYYIDPQREIIVMMREDVSDLIRDESDKNRILADALEAANQASHAKSQFLSRVSHELRTPLNAIIGFMELAKDASPEQIAVYLGNSDAAAKQLLSVINDVLDVSSIESGKLRIAYAPFDLERLIQSVDNLYRPQCMQKGVALHTQLLTPIDGWLMGDQLRINQILFNLMNNALKFTAKGQISLKVSQRPARRERVVISFEVSDSGCGMSEEMQKRLFCAFEQESTATAQKYGGSGLGLYIVNSLVNMMDGAIRVHSRQGLGTSFIVDLPFDKSDLKSSAPDGEQLQGAMSDLSDMRVLLAEDNAMNRLFAQTLLNNKFGVQCDCADDGRIALDMFSSSEPGYYDAILMDIQMPNMDGFECTRQIRACNHPDAAEIQIVALTANAFNEDIVKSLSSGMNAHVAKPIEPEVLCAVLARAYAARRQKSASDKEAPVSPD